KFCGECGSKIESNCPECGFVNPPTHKFCGECGKPLQGSKAPDLSPLEEKIDKIQRYLPEGLTQKILAQKDRIEGERKQVTVMFCDLVGFTSMSEKLDPEETYSIMDRLLEILIHKVNDFGGTVNKMMGDGIMALFGAPIALEDGPQRAIRSAIAIHKEITRFSEKIRKEKEYLPPLKMRIGINSGPVVVGTIGNTLRVEFTAIGDTVNLASRMETLADPGTTFVTAETFNLTEVFFRFEALGEKQVKGKEVPVKVYQVIATSDRSTRFDVSAERGLTPLVGRERELEMLLDGFETAKSGRGQGFSIVAEAGTGKSRLLYEFRKSITTEDVTILEGKCLSYSKNVAYHPVFDIVRSGFEIEEDNTEEQIRQKLEAGLLILKMEITRALPYLLELFNIKESGIDPSIKTPDLINEQIVKTLLQVIIKRSEITPLVLIVEDLHWIDDSSEKLLLKLLEIVAGSRIMIVYTFRPEYKKNWPNKTYLNQLNLNRFSNRESTLMLANLIGEEAVDGRLAELVIEKTDNNAFYIEEFIRSLINTGVLQKMENRYQIVKEIDSNTIPSSIRDILMARIDTLPEETREILQITSVIEREFSYRLIHHLLDVDKTSLLAGLSLLKEAELIYERGIHPETVYIFKHSLTREVIYDSILTKKQKILHCKVAEAIETLFKDSLNDYFEVLADHFIAGEDFEKGAEYAKLAARKAYQFGSFKDAITYAEKAVFCLEKMPATDDIQIKIIGARTRIGGYCLDLNHQDKAKEAINPIIDLAIKTDCRNYLPVIYNIIGLHSMLIENNYTKSSKYLNKALKISKETNNYPAFASANFFLGIGFAIKKEFQKSLYHFNQALELAEAANLIPMIIATKSTMIMYPYFHEGKSEIAYQLGNEVLVSASVCDDRTKGFAYTGYGHACFLKGNFDEANDCLSKSLKLLEKAGQFLWASLSSVLLGDICILIQKYEDAYNYYDKAISYAKMINSPPFMGLYEIYLAKAKVVCTHAVDLAVIFDIYNNLKENIGTGITGILELNIGEVLYHIGDHHLSEAEVWINKAIETNKKEGSKLDLWRSYILYSQFYQKQNKLSQAREQMINAIEIMKECGADGWVERY
ncbi:MAG: AAA family ATPase, partial [SAR324 cluster bacterium]|nr:AAA family ATPase [SAR324 cluster bacterium]